MGGLRFDTLGYTRLKIVLVVFILVLAAGFAARKTILVRSAHGGATDLPQAMMAATSLMPTGKLPIVIIDIDDRTMWGDWQREGAQTPLTPRRDLAHLIAEVLATGPAFLVIDLDLGFADPDGGAGDETLLRVFSDQARKSGTHVLLVQGQIPIMSGDEGIGNSSDSPEASGPGAFRESPFDKLFERSDVPGTAKWLWRFGTATRLDEADTVRWFSLWTRECSAGGEAGRAVLSAPLLIEILRTTSREVQERTVESVLALARSDPHSCIGTGRNPSPGELDTVPDRLRPWVAGALRRPIESSRIPYTFENFWDAAVRRPGQSFASRLPADQPDAPSGLTITPVQAFRAGEREALRGAIVIIGRSDVESGDLKITPLGKMQGTGILANTITAVAARSEPLIGKFSIILVSIVFTGGLLALSALLQLDGLIELLALAGASLVSATIFGVLLAMNFWVDLSIPLFAAGPAYLVMKILSPTWSRMLS